MCTFSRAVMLVHIQYWYPSILFECNPRILSNGVTSLKWKLKTIFLREFISLWPKLLWFKSYVFVPASHFCPRIFECNARKLPIRVISTEAPNPSLLGQGCYRYFRKYDNFCDKPPSCNQQLWMFLNTCSALKHLFIVVLSLFTENLITVFLSYKL